MRFLLPLPADRPAQRWTMLLGGLALYGVSSGLIVRAGLGLDPWDVLHQGLARTFGGQVGTWAILASVGVLLLWLPLRSRFGVGTLANAVLVGLGINATVWLVPAPPGLVVRTGVLVAGVALNGVATGLYIGAGLGPGPRDGLTTSIAARGHSIRLVRTVIEAAVLVGGWLLGGSVGIGTVLYALAIGPLTHKTIPWLAIRRPGEAPRRQVQPALAEVEPAAGGVHVHGVGQPGRRDQPEVDRLPAVGEVGQCQ
ncbi:MAG TPA: hypothetical protein VLM05_06770 [Mycobacteriales bacterium]|nr:hypothetical protein [Mycobacteriales bacterium]